MALVRSCCASGIVLAIHLCQRTHLIAFRGIGRVGDDLLRGLDESIQIAPAQFERG